MSDRQLKITQNIQENIKIQNTIYNKLNYLNSCINHGGEIGEIAIEIMNELIGNREYSI